MAKNIYCVDWGTSSLRVRLVDTKSGELIDQVITDYGISKVFDDWQKQCRMTTVSDRIEFYLTHLKKHMAGLSDRTEINTDGIPLVISGMASSNLGIAELRYAELPFALTGKDMIVSEIEASAGFNHPVIILSGVKCGHEVMRGEETQLIGIADMVPTLRNSDNAVVLLPGTHSKHVYLEGGFMHKIETYVTGELFALLTRNGLLKESVQPPDDVTDEPKWRDAFIAGVDSSAVMPLLQGIFNVRTNHIFNTLDRQQNYSFLSGMLIGYELRNLLNRKNIPMFLCSESNLYAQYRLALERIGLKDVVCLVEPNIVGQATVKGQILMAQQYLIES